MKNIIGKKVKFYFIFTWYFLSFIVVLGSLGALELEFIGFAQCFKQILLGIFSIFLAALISKQKGDWL